MKKVPYLIIVILFLTGCYQNKRTDITQYKVIGDSIATTVQGNLLKNVSKAVADSGFIYAVEFCHLNAENITQAVAGNNNIISIQRISDLNRNPKNAIKTAQDSIVFEYFKVASKDTAVVLSEKVVYYKPINIMMPTCLKCHGEKNSMDPLLFKTIKSKYPEDLAMGYEEGDLRGMWKITMER